MDRHGRLAFPSRQPPWKRSRATRSLGAWSSLLIAAAFGIGPLAAQQEDRYDYFGHNREMIQAGVQAVLMCNGLFTSNRSLEQVFAQELAYLQRPIGSARGGDYEVDRERRTVAVGTPGGVPVMRAAFRDGLGCVVLAPDQTFEDLEELPRLELPPAPDVSQVPWPMGDLVEEEPLTAGIDAAKLQAASDWAFDRGTPEQDTLSLLIVHRGRIVHERYADGVDRTTRTRTWSTAKSIAATLIGLLVDRGEMQLDAPLDVEWLPEVAAAETDPRRAITLRHVLHMSSGLDPVDSFGLEYASGSGLSYWAGASSVDGARRRGLIRQPGTYWDYENYDTLLAVLAMRRALERRHPEDDPQQARQRYLEFPHRELLQRLGMHSTLLSVDRFGDFVLSSQVYTNARDLARFGMLYAQGGVWMGERLLSQEWVDFVRTPAPASAVRHSDYGGQFWLVPTDRSDVPPGAYSTAGNRGQFVVIDPSHELVIVRRGLDWGRQGFDRWELLREVLKAFGEEGAGESSAD